MVKLTFQILNMKPPWESLEGKQLPEDIIYMLRKGGQHPIRPKLDPIAQDLSPAFVSYSLEFLNSIQIFSNTLSVTVLLRRRLKGPKLRLFLLFCSR